MPDDPEEFEDESMTAFLIRRWRDATDDFGLFVGTLLWLGPTLIIGPFYLLHWLLYYLFSGIHWVIRRA